VARFGNASEQRRLGDRASRFTYANALYQMLKRIANGNRDSNISVSSGISHGAMALI
jgi:hypothetical protein